MSGTTTPPSASFSSAPYSDAEKADIRRFCGYPPYGSGPSGFSGWRFFTAYGELEFKMNNSAPAEYQIGRYRLSLLYVIETALSGAYQTLNVDTAASFKRNSREVQDRIAHYNSERRTLCDVMGCPPGPNLAGAGSVAIVV
jgi:hypothetical protein